VSKKLFLGDKIACLTAANKLRVMNRQACWVKYADDEKWWCLHSRTWKMFAYKVLALVLSFSAMMAG
jgi:hypothetical protein